MFARILLASFLMVLFGPDGAQEGRRGNEFYKQGQYAQAAEAYRAGLEAHGAPPDAVYAALWNNLGAALHREKNLKEAQDAFTQAISAAPTKADRARAYYNAGNNAVALKDPEAALEFYRQALLADPTYENARYNYEYIKRRMNDQSSPRQQPPNIEPSDYARQLKQRAEAMAARRQYAEAHQLMMQGLQQDSTVAAYRSFITRLGNVAQIDTITQQSP